MGNYHFDWVRSPEDGDWYWVKRIFRELSHYYDDYTEDVSEIPFNYTERTFVGSLAIAAHECGFYTLQEYASKHERERCRFPDFWITLEPQKSSYDVVFEIKKMKAKFGMAGDKYEEKIRRGIRKASDRYLQLHEIGEREKSRFQCALAAIQIQCDEKQWQKINKSESYNEVIETLKHKMIELSEKGAAFGDGESHSLWYLYWLPFHRINDERFKQYYWSGEKSSKRDPYTKPALALLVCGSFKRVS